MGTGYGRDGPYGGEGGGGHNAPAPVYAPPPEEAVETLMVRQLQAHPCLSNCLIVCFIVMSYHVLSYVMSCHVMSCHVLSFQLHLVTAPFSSVLIDCYRAFLPSQGMGFDRPAVLAALRSNGNSVEAAANMLLR